MTDRKQPVDKGHGGVDLPTVHIDSMNLELRTPDGFLGDRANKSAFWASLESWRERMRDETDEDPFGGTPTSKLGKKRLDDALSEGSGDEAGLVLGAIESFANDLASVILEFLKQKAWEDTQRIAIGGGMRSGRVGEIAISRAGVLLKARGAQVDLMPVRLDPHDAGLVGAAHLMPRWTLKGYDCLLGVDIGGTNIRAGVVSLNLSKKSDLSKARVWKSEIWRHADDKPSRTAAVQRLVEMLQTLIDEAQEDSLQVAPFIGVGCPGQIRADGVIERGGQNLPGGNWESERFVLPALLSEAIPRIGEHATHIIMHNDAVVQGLSQAPFMSDVEKWGVLTIGTGLGNARFTNRRT